MNLITLNNNNSIKTMTSLEIADLTNKTHSNVLRDIRRMIEEIGESNLNHEQYQVVTDDRGYTSEILLDRELTEVLVTGYSVVIRRAVIQRWKELEDQVANNAPALPTTYLDALKALVSSEEEKVVMMEQLTVAAPKLAYYEQVLEQKEIYTISEVAKKNGITAQELNRLLLAGGVYDKRSNGKTFKTDFMDKGYGKMITARTGHTQAKLTIKGEVWVTNVVMKCEAAKEILAARKAKAAKTAHRPLKLSTEQVGARDKHTESTIQRIDTILKQA